MDPWRYSTEGISIALRVTPRGGRDDIDGIETLANGRSVVKVRVRAVADGGEANRAVMELLAKALGVPKARVRILSGTTSRMKQVAVDGDPKVLGEILGETLRKATAIAFSSEVDAGSRKENASKKRAEPGSDLIRTERLKFEKTKD